MHAVRTGGYSPGEGIRLRNYCENIITYIRVADPALNVSRCIWDCYFPRILRTSKQALAAYPTPLFSFVFPHFQHTGTGLCVCV